MDLWSSRSGSTGKLRVCARWAAAGGEARAYKRSAKQDLDKLMQQTPGLQLHEDIDKPTEDEDTQAWDTQDFAPRPGEPPLLWSCWLWGYKVWQHMADQWRVGGMGNIVGLDLTALPIVEDRIGMPADQRQEAYVALRAFAGAQQERWHAEQKAAQNDPNRRH